MGTRNAQKSFDVFLGINISLMGKVLAQKVLMGKVLAGAPYPLGGGGVVIRELYI